MTKKNDTGGVFILVGVGAVIFLAVFTYFAQSYIATQRANVTGLQPADEGSFLSFSGIVVVMIAGIAASHLFEKIKTAGNKPVNLLQEISAMVSSPKFIMALLVSPLLFNTVYLVIGHNPQSMGDYLLAFQNGFFWESVLGSLVHRIQGGAA